MDFSSVLSKALPFVIAVLFFGLIIFIHEFGHFIFAKLFGVKVNEFAIGMGPTLFKKQGKETKYALRLLPFGGFVSMEGEEEESEDSRAFCNQKVYKRMIIIAAGAVFNLILGFIVCIFLVCGEEYVGTNQILQFYEGAVSSQSGLAVGDEILEIDGKRVFSDYDISYFMQRNSSGKYDFTVRRNGEKVVLEDVTFMKRTSGNFYYREDCSVYDISAALKDQGFKDGDIILSVNGESVKNAEELIAQIDADKDFTYDFTLKRGEEELSLSQVLLNTATVFDFSILGEEKDVLNVLDSALSYSLSMGRMVYLSLFDLLRGQYGLNDLAGPIGTVTVIADIAQSSMVNVDWSGLFMMMAMITINIGLFNLLPIPALDGGHLFFMVFEIIFRKPVPQKYESWIHAAGLIILLVFMAVISFSDIWKLVSGRGFY
ncbi:MAG: RIP metalloprotease RseP [Clostridia bacterium]|nr:RIP metalloprotease RseP [Clostridia bacterium]